MQKMKRNKLGCKREGRESAHGSLASLITQASEHTGCNAASYVMDQACRINELRRSVAHKLCHRLKPQQSPFVDYVFGRDCNTFCAASLDRKDHRIRFVDEQFLSGDFICGIVSGVGCAEH